MTKLKLKPIPVDFAVDLYTGLLSVRRTKLQPALSAAVESVGIVKVDADLKRLVPLSTLTHVASLGVRGERVFPTPALIRHAPALIGYYRMLLGISQKEFGQRERLGYAAWVTAENTGRLTYQLDQALDVFCAALIKPLTKLVAAMQNFDNHDLNDLTLLTLGPTLQGGRNNAIGSKAAEGILGSIRIVLGRRITFESSRIVRISTKSGRLLELLAGSEPDIAIVEGAGTQARPLLAIEVKGGKDVSNAYNRAGEAEKSHISAKLQGYKECWTIIQMRGADRNKIIEKTPSSGEIFDAEHLLRRSGNDWLRFRLKLLELIA